MNNNHDNISQAQIKYTSRDRNFDYLKTFAILGVVYIHSGIPFSGIFRFCVPVFIGMWAFYMERGLARRSVDSYRQYLIDRLKVLLIPYAFWSILYISFYPPSAWFTTPIHTIIGGWLGGYAWGGQYYFIILIQLTLLFPVARNWINRNNFWILIGVGGIVNVIAEYFLGGNKIIFGINDRLFIYWIPYVVLGLSLARGYITAKSKVLLPALLCLLLISTESGYLNGWSPYLGVAVTCGSLALLLGLAPTKNLKNSGEISVKLSSWNRLSDLIGQNTFPIFVSNVLFLKIVDFIQYSFAIYPTEFVPLLLRHILVFSFVTIGGLLTGFIFRSLGLGILVGSK
jgi:surface polysaccharide O-acyltransferase-like enzyme